MADELTKPTNHFDKFDGFEDAQEPGLADRFRLNSVEAYYRGTLQGSAKLQNLARISSMTPEDFDKEFPKNVVTDDPFERAAAVQRRAVRNLYRDQKSYQDEYNEVLLDLAQYDSMRGFGSTLEATAAFGGQLAGALPAVENLVPTPIRGATLLQRAASAGAGQGVIQFATDPVVQTLTIKGGGQEHYEPLRTAIAPAMGFIIGGGIHMGGELLGSAYLKKVMKDQAKDDPQFRSPIEQIFDNADGNQKGLETRLGDLEAEAVVLQEKFDSVKQQSGPESLEWKAAQEAIEVNKREQGEIKSQLEERIPEAAMIEPKEPKEPDWQAVDKIEKELPADISRAIDEWVGGPTGAKDTGYTGGVFSYNRFLELMKDEKKAQELSKIMKPVLDDLRAKNGDTITLYRTQHTDIEEAKTRGFVSFTADKKFADAYAQVGKKRDLFSPEEIKAKEQELNEKGEVKIGRFTLIKEGDMIEIHDPSVGGFVTDTPSVKDFITDLNADRAKLNNISAENAKKVLVREVPIEDIVFVTDRFNQKEFIVKSRNLDEPKPDEQASIAQRRMGGSLRDEQGRGKAGLPATVDEAPAPRAQEIKSLQQQSIAFAEAIDFPLREKRMGVKGALGTFNRRTGVVRVDEVPDFEVVTHEAGHAIEAKVGPALSTLMRQNVTELAPLVSNPQAYPPNEWVPEGFAEYIRRYIGNPAHAAQVAPNFTNEFRLFMQQNAPDVLKAIDDASNAYRAYLQAPTEEVLHSIVRSKADYPEGYKKILKDLKENGFAPTVKNVIFNTYGGLFDDKAPMATMVRELGKAIKDQTGDLVKLKAADNPEVLLRLAERSQQAALGDMIDGVRGYHETTIEGPSLADAIAVATGSPSRFGRWDTEKKEMFSDYLIARMGVVAWEKFEAGLIPNPPMALSKSELQSAVNDFEAAMPTFAQGGDMVHLWTRQLLLKARNGGLITQELFDKLTEQRFYVPLFRDVKDKPLASEAGATGDTGSVIGRMKGSSRDVMDPLESLMMQAFLINRSLQHNDVIQSMVRLSRKAGIAGGKYVEPIKAHEARAYTFDLLDGVRNAGRERGMNPNDTELLAQTVSDFFGDDPIMTTYFKMEPTGKRGEPIVFYREDGYLKAARVISESEGLGVYELLTALPKGMTDVFSNVVAGVTIVSRAGIVTNPTYVVSNYIRDQMAAGILRSDYVPGFSGLTGIKAELTQNEIAKLYGYGGGMSAGTAVAPVDKAVQADINALAKRGYVINRVSSLKGFIEATQVTEAGTRLSVFKKVYENGRRNGLSDYEAMIDAAMQATDLPDFSRHGSRTLWLRQYLQFINSWAQGMDKARRTMVSPLTREMVFTTDPAERQNAILANTKVFGIGALLGAGYAAVMLDDEAYLDASSTLKGTHFVIPNGNKITVVPKPFELGIGFTMGEYAMQRLKNDDPRALKQFAEAAWESIKPQNPLSEITIFKTYAELHLGKSFFTGRDIVPSRLQGLPAPMQTLPNTSEFAKTIGTAIGVSPIKVDYAIGSLFTSWGRDIIALSGGTSEDNPERGWDETVFTRRFLKDPNKMSDATMQFWKFIATKTGEFNQAKTAYDSLIASFQEDKAQSFLSQLDPDKKVFVTLASGADEDGKAVFKADDRRSHPLNRAYDAVSVLNGLRQELIDNSFKFFETGQNVKMSPKERKLLIDNVRELAQMEIRNSLVMVGEKGYKNRPLLNLDVTMDKIRNLSPEVANEIATRYATRKIYKSDAVASVYEQLKTRIMSNGSEADIDDLVGNVTSQGYQFEGERVRRPQKRRVPIKGSN